MTTEEKVLHKIHHVEHELSVMERLGARGNKFAEGYAVALRDQLRWLRWVQGD